MGLMPATTDPRFHQQSIIPHEQDRLHRTVATSSKDSRFIMTDFHTYPICGSHRKRVQLLIVEDKLDMDPEEQCRNYLKQCFSANPETLGLGVRYDMENPGLEFLLMKCDGSKADEISIIPSKSGDMWHKYDSNELFQELQRLAEKLWGGKE
ncbi:hypothetical protein GYMLUDRAFT_67735 [Collybiopsis luxurians FD-317 M1]|nr:hypothetical protein GYMLUDRAFT_67735 [Collybiopsis luxurians FD-317 M1]